MISYWQDALVSGENIRTINGEEIIGDGSNMELATKDEINAKADDSSVVHKTIDETITGTKTFRGQVKFLHSGDNSVVFGADTRIGVDGTNDNVLGFIHGSFVVNNSNYPLYLYSQTTRPIYNNTEELALLSDVNGKQDVITDLASIREGASKGATALQSIPSEYVTETELTAKGYATTSALNDKVDKVSGKQLSTEDFTSALKTKLEGLSNYDDTELSEAIETLRGDFDNIVSGDTTTAIKTFNEVIAFLDGLTDTQDLESIIASIEQQIAGKMDKVTLAAVATSGNYNDLTNKPTIPAAVTESTVSGWGFTKNAGTYSKPSGGIPKSDLASAVQTSLGKADTALQSYTEQYKGTVTGVKINGTTKNPSSGVVDLGTVITSHQDISGKQDKLVSGTNIKTINGQSILGSGDITISGGGGSSSGSGAYSEVNHGTSDTTFALTPNTFHVWEEVSALTLTLGSETAGVANEFLFQFTSGTTATTLTLPDDIKWANDSAPTIGENMIYQVSILKGMASVLEFGNAPRLIRFYVKLAGDWRALECPPNMTWADYVNSEYNTGQYILAINGNKITYSLFAIKNQTPSDTIVEGQYYDMYLND